MGDLDTILNSSMEEFIKVLDDFNVGELNSLLNVLILHYHSMVRCKDALLNDESLTAEDIEGTLKNIYITLQRCEEKIQAIKVVLNGRTGKN